jgi:hypothetical protein
MDVFMDLEFWSYQMEVNMKDNFKRIKKKVRANFFGLTVRSMRDHGQMISKMVKEL